MIIQKARAPHVPPGIHSESFLGYGKQLVKMGSKADQKVVIVTGSTVHPHLTLSHHQSPWLTYR